MEPPRLSPEAVARVAALAPDALVVAAYGLIIPDSLLAIPRLGPWNVHPSLLPRWRGPAPIHRTIWAGDTETGVTIIRVTSRVDAGPMALYERTPVDGSEDRGALERRLATIGASLMVRSLDEMERGTLGTTEQDESRATYAGVFAPEEAAISWDRPSDAIDRLVRALLPAPGAHFPFRGSRVKVLAASPDTAQDEPGRLVRREEEGAWTVACGKGGLRMRMVHPAGGKPMTMDEFVRGRRLSAGERLA
jgi:methionyl-tRNA formyltransferase